MWIKSVGRRLLRLLMNEVEVLIEFGNPSRRPASVGSLASILTDMFKQLRSESVNGCNFPQATTCNGPVSSNIGKQPRNGWPS